MPGSLEHGTNEAKFAHFNSSSWQLALQKSEAIPQTLE